MIYMVEPFYQFKEFYDLILSASFFPLITAKVFNFPLD